MIIASDDYGEIHVTSIDSNNLDRNEAIKRALSRCNLETTFKIIVYIKNKVETMSKFRLDEITNECMTILNRCITTKDLQKKKSFTLGNGKKVTDKCIVYNIVRYIKNGYSIERLYNRINDIGNCGYKKVNIADILCLVSELSITGADIDYSKIEKMSETNICKIANAILDENILLSYRSLYNTAPISLYLIQPDTLNKLENGDRDDYKEIYEKINYKPINYTLESYNRAINNSINERKSLGIEQLKKLNKNEFRLYMLINPVINIKTNSVIMDTSALNTIYCYDYIERFVYTKSRERLNSEYGYNQERFIEIIINKIFNNKDFVHIEKINESNEEKRYDFNIYISNKCIIHAESKFAIGKVTTHYKKENTDKKAMKQLRNFSVDNIKNVIVNTASTYLFEYKTHDNMNVKSLSILGLIGYIILLAAEEDNINNDIYKDALTMEIMGLVLILNTLKR